ncbi:MAG: hypothetical protein RL213_1455 [Bacteroidota bacterium]|jgi:hypothetical protein
MRKKGQLLFLAAFLWILSLPARAEYTTSIGARVGKFAHGLVVKHFFNTNANFGLEGLAAWTKEGRNGYTGRIYAVKQLPIINAKLHIPIDFIIGGGAHAGFFKRQYYDIVDGGASYYNEKTMTAGLGATFQLEFDSERFPVTLGIQADPFYNFLNPGPEWIDFGLTLRVKL